MDGDYCVRRFVQRTDDRELLPSPYASKANTLFGPILVAGV
jgi:hypothetical protein